jgi:hypothetical protein
MFLTFVDGLAGLGELGPKPSLRIVGLNAFIRSPRFIGCFSLESGQVKWLAERSLAKWTESIWSLPRRILPSGSELWSSEGNEIVAEILPTEDGSILISTRDAQTGRLLWEHFIAVPEAAEWAEPSPAWPGAQTEEICAFIANDTKRLVVCLFRQSRRSGLSCPARGIEILTLPPYSCQTDAIRFDLLSGRPIWSGSFPDLRVGIIERDSFVGIWSNQAKLGTLDFESGTILDLYESPHQLGWPVCHSSLLSVPWHSKKDVGVDWIDVSGRLIHQVTWRLPGVRSASLHVTDAGLALQTNDQRLWWLGQDHRPLWDIRAKPYIYRVYGCPTTDVFVGTDGRGGRLLGFDATSGQETLSLRPHVGGAGGLAKVPGHEVLVAKSWTSSKDPTAGRLLILSMADRSYSMGHHCLELLGTWRHGAVCLSGTDCERLAIVDVRSSGN